MMINVIGRPSVSQKIYRKSSTDLRVGGPASYSKLMVSLPNQ
jgi:hypothetical protein